MNKYKRTEFNELMKNDFQSDTTQRMTNVVLNEGDINCLLLRNTNNIPPSSHKVKEYAAQMTNGQWKYNGDSIRIGKSGALLDGQNRLLAAKSAKVDLVTDICYGLDDDVFNTIDVGRVRSNGHLMFREFVNVINKPSEGHMLARAVKKIILHDHGYSQCAATHRMNYAKLRISDSLLIDYVKKNKMVLEHLKYVRASFGTDSVVPRATILYVYHIGARFDDSYARAFIDKAFGGEHLIRNEACYHLYNFLRRVKQKTLRWTAAEVENTIIKVWNIVAKRGTYKINTPNNIKARPDEKVFVMERPDENIRHSVKLPSGQ